jgi:hypothetical protein
VLFGGVAQVAIGIPLCFVWSWIGAPFWRRLVAVVAVALALIPFGFLWTDSIVTLVVVVGCIAAGVRISMRTFRPQGNQEAEQAVAHQRAISPAITSQPPSQSRPWADI